MTLPTEPLELHRALGPVLATDSAPAWHGPRWWWNGPLDVEGLALGSALAVAAAVERRTLSTSSELVNASFNSIGHLRVDGRAAEGWAPLSGFKATADGWVRLHANYPHHAKKLLTALELESGDQLEDALLERTATEVEDVVTAAGGVASAVRTPDEWAGSPMGEAARSHPWIEFVTDAGRPTDTMRILDLTRVIAGPSATRLLGALGADVLRVDPPQLPELTDQHIDTGFSKRSALADLRDRAQLARIRQLLAEADVVVLGYRSSALARFGLDPVSLRADYPDLVVASVNAWGRTGPWADARGFDSIVQAATGIAHLYGANRGGSWRPGALPVQALDHATGLGIAAAVLALLRARREGVTGRAHLSLATTAAMLMGFPPPPSGGVELEIPHRSVESDYGLLDYVPPVLEPLEYMHPPVRYGSSVLEWVSASATAENRQVTAEPRISG